MDGTRVQLDREACRRVGAEVHRLRCDRGWSLAELSVKAHYSVGYLSKIENGKKRVTPEMARAFDELFATGGVLSGLVVTREERIPVVEPEASDVGRCPYPGLAAFGPGEARWFFGREQVTADLVRRLDECLGGGEPLAVVAPSGAGKSSLLAAGLIPALAGGALPGSRDWPVVCVTPGAHPLATLVDRVAAATGTDPAAATEVAGDRDRFAAFLTQALVGGKLGETSSSARLVLIVDQFEEIFTECRSDAERRAFIAALGAAAGPMVLVVIGLRADFYGQCLAHPVLLAALQAPVALGPMTPDQLRAIITAPAETEGLDVEAGLVELLLRDLGVTDDPAAADTAGYDPGALPLLAHALRVTWQQRQGRMLTVAGYRRTGGIRQALGSTAERAYTRLGPTEQQITRQVLLRLVNVRDQGKDTRHRLTRTQLVEALSVPAHTVEHVLEVLGRSRLITFDADHVEITHEALLSAWPRLAGWVSADRAGLRTHQQLSEAAGAWEAASRDPSRLYRGSQLALTHDWATDPTRHDRLSTREKAFLGASLDQQHREQHAHRRRTRRARQLVAVFTAVIVIAATGFVLRNIAASQRDQAFSAMLAARATQLSANDPTRGMQLSAAAYGIADSTPTRSSLLSASTLHSATSVLADIGSINTVAISGHVLAAGSADQTIRLYDISSPTAPTFLSSITDHTDLINAVAFSPDGHTLASGGSDRTVRLWDISDPRHPHLFDIRNTNIGHRQGVNAMAFSPDGHTLAIGGADGTVQLWDLTHRDNPLTTLPGRSAYVNAVTFSPTSGSTLISGNDDGTVRLWDLTHPHNPPRILTDTAHPTDEVDTVAVSPNGSTLASGTENGIVQLWDLTNSHQGTPFFTTPRGRTGSGANKAVAFSADGRTLAIGNTSHSDGTVWLADLTNIHESAPTDLPVTAVPVGSDITSVNAIAFTPDGHTLTTGSSTAANGSTGVVALADVADPHHPTPLPPLWRKVINSVDSVAFSPDGHTVASGIDPTSDSGAPSSGMVLLWDVDHPGNPPAGLPGGAGAVDSVAFSPSDGHIVASGGDDGTVRVWALTHPDKPLATLPGGAGAVHAVAFSPDGHTLASGDGDGTLRLWDLSNPAQPQPLDVLIGNTSWVTAVAFSAHGHLLASGGADGIMRLWDVSNPHHILALPDLAKDVTFIRSVAFNPDGTLLVSGNNDGTLSLWDLTDHHQPARAATPTLAAHDQMIRALAFSPDGHTLATGSNDYTVKLWDFTNHGHPTLSAILTGHGYNVRALAFNPSDGHTLASGSDDTQIRLWETNPDKAAKEICSLTTTTRITDDQWKQYFPNMPHRPSCP